LVFGFNLEKDFYSGSKSLRKILRAFANLTMLVKEGFPVAISIVIFALNIASYFFSCAPQNLYSNF